MAKRDLAFELFDEGKTPEDPEVKALGLTKESLRKYYSNWKKQSEAPVEAPVEAPAEPVEVRLSTLPIAAEFELQGSLYRVAGKEEDFVIIHKLQIVGDDMGAPMKKVTGQSTLADYIMVKPIK